MRRRVISSAMARALGACALPTSTPPRAVRLGELRRRQRCALPTSTPSRRARGLELGALPSFTKADVLAAMPASAQAAYQQAQTTFDQSGAANAAAGAADLAAGGFDPNSPADQQKIVHVVAGAVSLVPGVGPILGGVVEALNFVGGKVIAPVLDKLLGHCTDPNGCCTHTGTWTFAQVAQEAGAAAPPPAGTLAALAVPVLVQQATAALNCAPSFAQSAYAILVPGVLAVWDSAAAGALLDYFVPRLASMDATLPQPAWWVRPARVAIFGPFAYPEQGPYAFRPLAEVPASIATPAGEGTTWTRVRANAGPVRVRPVHAVTLHLGAGNAVALHPMMAGHVGAVGGASSAATVATVAAAGAGVAALAWVGTHGWNVKRAAAAVKPAWRRIARKR